MSAARGHATATLLPDGKVLVAGGLGAGYLASAEVYDPTRGTWTPTGSMGTARAFHTATLLPNGKVLVAGGQGASDMTLPSAELYDPAAGTWIAAAAMTGARRQHTATLLPSGKLLVAGGRGATDPLASAELYDPTLDAWSAAGALATPRSEHAAALLPSGHVLVTGGRDGGGASLASTELHDPALGTWAPAAPLTAARHQHTATLLATGEVLVAGGSGGAAWVAGAERFDPVTGSWAPAGSLATARGAHSATLLPSGRLLVAGGTGAAGTLSSAEVYDPATPGWSASSAMVSARREHAATLLPSGKVLLVGGSDAGGYLATAELRDPSSPSWRGSGPLGVARSRHTATILTSGKVLVSGGTTVPDAIAELYDPSSRTWSTTDWVQGRFDHTATLLSSGKVLLVGGRSGPTSSPLRTAELYDPDAGASSATGELRIQRTQHTATLLASGKVLVAGGTNAGGAVGSAELYDPDTGTWAETGSLVTARSRHTATLLPSGKVLVAGGVGTSSLASAELYDPAEGTWSTTGSMILARGWAQPGGSSHTATLLPTGKVLVIGGTSSATAAELYDPAAGTWSVTSFIGSARRHHTATLLPSGKVLVACGLDPAAAPTPSAELFDPETGAVTATAALETRRYLHTATVLPSGEVLVAGGELTSGTPVVTVETYDEGRGADAGWTPVLGSVPEWALAGEVVALEGERFTGVSEGSGGATQASPGSFPLVLVRRDDGTIQYATVTAFTATAVTAKLPASLQVGWQWVQVVVNGVPSAAKPLLVSPLAIWPPIQGQEPNESVAFEPVGGSGAGYVWSLAAAPSGGTIDEASGLYVAGPTVGVTDVVRLTDSAGNVATRSVAVAGLSISPDGATLAPRDGMAFVAAGGSGNGYVWSLETNGSGGSIDAENGLYTAGPVGGVTDVVLVTDALGNVASRTVAVTAAVSISPATAAQAPLGAIAFSAAGGSGAGYVWSLAAAPSGGSIDAETGAYLAGPVGGVVDVVEVVDSLGNAAVQNVAVAELSIVPGEPSTPPKGAIAFTAAGGSLAGRSWSLETNASGGSIDAGTGAYVAGATGGVLDRVKVTDSLGNEAALWVVVTAGPTISGAASLPPLGHTSFSATGGSGAGWSWSLAANPSGATIHSATGVYAAGPTGDVVDVVQVSDSLGNVATLNVTVTAGLSISGAGSVPPRGGVLFSGAGGSGLSFTWSLATNPSGGSIDASTGAYLAGPNPSVIDVVQLSDSLGNVATLGVTVTAGASISPALASVPPRGSRTFAANGGSGSFTWSLEASPSGGSIDPATGAYVAGPASEVTDVVRVVDSLGNFATADVSVTAGVSVSPAAATLPPRGGQAFVAAGGSEAGFTWSFVANASGGTLDATGAYTAGPTGGVTDVLRVTDPLGNSATASVTVTAGLSASPASVTTPPRGPPRTFTAAGGSGAGLSWSFATNASGGSLDPATGAYAPGATGGATDVLRVTDSLGNVATASVSVTAGVTISPAAASVDPGGAHVFSATGGSGEGFTWTFATNGSGASIDPATGAYTAGPTGGAADVVRVTDSLGNVATATVSVSAPAPAPPGGGGGGGGGCGTSGGEPSVLALALVALLWRRRRRASAA